jgi:hypothetical protein
MTKKRSLSIAFGVFLTIALSATASAGDGVVALQTADASCMPPWFVVGRYFDCGNGTVLDRNTGLVWLANANCFGTLDWHSAVEVVENLSDLHDRTICGGASGDDCDCGLSDNSSPGEWRLPSISEWREMTENAADQGCQNPALTDDLGLSCWTDECTSCSFYDVQSTWYWSASSEVLNPSNAYVLNLRYGSVTWNVKPGVLPVWPVRYGQ